LRSYEPDVFEVGVYGAASFDKIDQPLRKHYSKAHALREAVIEAGVDLGIWSTPKHTARKASK